MSSAGGRGCGGASGLSSWPTPAPGDFIYVPPFVPHQETQRQPGRPAVVRRRGSGQEPVVVNLDLPAVEPHPEPVHCVDDIHREP